MDVERIQSHDIVKAAGDLIVATRQKRPRVHCITNAAAQVMTANLLLVAGAIPSLSYATDEVADFVHRADALLINLGTLDAERRAAIPRAIATARDKQVPWILDPVFVDASAPRLNLADQLLAHSPSVIRCNRSEFEMLAGQRCEASTVSTFGQRWNTTVAVTGAEDLIMDANQAVHIANGHAWMSQTTAIGCAGTALIAAFCSINPSPLIAASAALVVLGIAGETAAKIAHGPGSFVPAFLDSIATITPDAITRTARVNHET